MILKKIILLLSGIAIAIVTILVLTKSNFSDRGNENEAIAIEQIKTENETATPAEAEEATITVTPAEAEKDINYLLAEKTPNPVLEDAIKKQVDFVSTEDITSTRYYYNYIDLNDDGLEEVIVELIGPYTSGSGGSTALIFGLSEDSFVFLQSLTLMSNPLIISNNITNGWHDIIFERSGGGYPSEMVVLRYDGVKYPLPSDAETLPKETAITGTGIIADDLAADLEEGKGLYLSE